MFDILHAAAANLTLLVASDSIYPIVSRTHSSSYIDLITVLLFADCHVELARERRANVLEAVY